MTGGAGFRSRILRRLVVGAVAATLIGGGFQPALAQSAGATAISGKASGPQGRGWVDIAKLPDWGGVWDADWSLLFGGPPQEQPQLVGPYLEAQKAFLAAQKVGDNVQTETANCLPPGMPQIMSQPYPVEFLFTPGKVTIAIEAYNQMRRVFTDGRGHPADPDPLWYGHSIGHWEGSTLVVDSVGFDPKTTLEPGAGHSDQLHVTEVIKQIQPDRIEIVTTMTDPKALAQPWTIKRQYVRHRDWDIKEYICEQNNRDAADAQGRPSMKLN